MEPTLVGAYQGNGSQSVTIPSGTTYVLIVASTVDTHVTGFALDSAALTSVAADTTFRGGVSAFELHDPSIGSGLALTVTGGQYLTRYEVYAYENVAADPFSGSITKDNDSVFTASQVAIASDPADAPGAVITGITGDSSGWTPAANADRNNLLNEDGITSGHGLWPGESPNETVGWNTDGAINWVQLAYNVEAGAASSGPSAALTRIGTRKFNDII